MFLSELLRRFADQGISYCIVGGVAVNLHGVPRMTYDLDLVVGMTEANLQAVERLLRDFGLTCRLPLELRELADAEHRKRMREERNLTAVTFTDPDNPLHEVDVLVSPRVPPTELIERAAKLDLEGTQVTVVALADLIALKRASERAQDADDAELLERIFTDSDADGEQDG